MATSPPNSRRLRFSSVHHLRTAGQFKRVYREGNRARGALMTVAAVENSEGCTRLGLSIGRVVWKSAVKRNRVRRLFREAFRLEFDRLPSGYDLVLIAVREAWPDLASARAELVRLAEKAARRFREKQVSEDPPEPDQL